MRHCNQMNKVVFAFTVLGIGITTHAAPVVKKTSNATYISNSSDNNFGNRETLGVRGDTELPTSQYIVMEFPLSGVSDPINKATLRLKTIGLKHQPWGSSKLPIQIMVLSEKNNAFAEGNGVRGANWETMNGTKAWTTATGSSGNLTKARDNAIANSTVFGDFWKANTWYDISLNEKTTTALERLRDAGEKAALVLIQTEPGSPGAVSKEGVRFWSDEAPSNSDVPQLIFDYVAGKNVPAVTQPVAQNNIKPAATQAPETTTDSPKKAPIAIIGLGGLILLIMVRMRAK